MRKVIKSLLFGAKKKAKKLHFSHARAEYSRSALLSAFVRVEQTEKRIV